METRWTGMPAWAFAVLGACAPLLPAHGAAAPPAAQSAAQPAAQSATQSAAQSADPTALRLASLFADHAVLQRDQPIAVWGTAPAHGKVALSLAGRTVHGRADAHGQWRLQLPALAAGGPYTLAATAGATSVAARDIMVGDVYLCAGQSNMEFAVRASTNAWSNTNAAGNPMLRFLNVQKASSPAPQDALKGPVEWKVADPATIGDASAVCYYMARVLQAQYRVPVGFVNASWGGTTIQGWIGAASLRTVAGYAAGVDAVAQLAADPQAAMRAEEARGEAWWDAHDPAAARERAFIAPGFDDAGWPTVTPAGGWKDAGVAGLQGHDGVAWFRTRVTLTAAQAAGANALQLGPIDTYDTTWVNGVRVGGGSTGWMWRDYAVPAGVFQPGENVIVVRVLNDGKGGQGGGLTGQPASRAVRTTGGENIPLPAAWRVRAGSTLTGQAVPPAPWDVPTSFTTLYNGMIAPLAGYRFKLAAWYQGESNAGAAQEYRSLLPLLMRDWRRRLDQPALPFLVVQLPGYGAPAKAPGRSAWAELRAAQADAVQDDAHAALVVTLDAGDRSDIHPTQKTVVGERLARAARAVAYGEPAPAGGAHAVSARRSGADIVVAFADTHGGLATYSSDRAIGFEVCRDAQCRYADATAAGDSVVLHGAWAAGATRVRYAWADAPFVNLFDGADLPAAPFQLDVR